ncbi:hypothetical protein IWW55_007465, partial [Coemansia sp. RSA 2706]
IPFPAGANARIQTHNAHFVDFVPVYTETAQLYAAALSKHTPVVAEALLPTTPENVWVILATSLCVPGESSASQATIQRVSDDQDPDSEKHELADKERELRVLPRRVIPQFRPLEYKQIINAGPDRMAEPSLIIAHSEPRPLREAPIRNIDVVQVQGIAEQTEGTAASVLARANRELGLALATDEIA